MSNVHDAWIWSKHYTSSAWWHSIAIPTIGRQKKKGQKFKVTLRNRVNTRPAPGYVRIPTSH